MAEFLKARRMLRKRRSKSRGKVPLNKDMMKKLRPHPPRFMSLDETKRRRWMKICFLIRRQTFTHIFHLMPHIVFSVTSSEPPPLLFSTLSSSPPPLLHPSSSPPPPPLFSPPPPLPPVCVAGSPVKSSRSSSGSFRCCCWLGILLLLLLLKWISEGAAVTLSWSRPVQAPQAGPGRTGPVQAPQA